MANVRGDSYICIVDPSGTIKNYILEQDFEPLGYKARGWKVVKEDWTKDRIVKQPVDVTKEMNLSKLASKN